MSQCSVSSDEVLNPDLKESVQTLRSLMLEQVQKEDAGSRFKFIPDEHEPFMHVVDSETGKTSEVALFAYRDVRRVLGELFR